MTSDGCVVSGGDAYACEAYDLRITQRCLEEDFEYYGAAPFEELANHEILRAFIKRRSDGPTDTKQVSPLSSGEMVYRLSYGDRHRGATWHDEERGVVWLLGYAQHGFADPNDAFDYFKELDADERLLPGPADLEQALRSADRRFVEGVQQDAKALLTAARSKPDEEHRAVIGGRLGVGVVMVVVLELEEVYVAVQTVGMSKEDFYLVIAALFPDRDFDQLETADRLPTRAPEPGEIVLKTLYG